jgi:hypothetical protein
MKTVYASLGAGLTLALSFATSAQSGDTKYCNDLGAAYQRYTEGGQAGRGYRPLSADISAAMTKCQSDPSSAIPVLEKALHDAKVELPKRS